MINVGVGYALCKLLGIDPSSVTYIEIRAIGERAEVTLTLLLSEEEMKRLAKIVGELKKDLRSGMI